MSSHLFARVFFLRTIALSPYLSPYLPTCVFVMGVLFAAAAFPNLSSQLFSLVSLHVSPLLGKKDKIRGTTRKGVVGSTHGHCIGSSRIVIIGAALYCTVRKEAKNYYILYIYIFRCVCVYIELVAFWCLV